MNAEFDPDPFADAILAVEEPDASAAWTLDELDRLADLDSLRSAWRADDRDG